MSIENTNILITGAQGEVGHSLIRYFCENTNHKIFALDLQPAGAHLLHSIENYQNRIEFIQGSVTDTNLLNSLGDKYIFSTIFHLAALLSSAGERDPLRAHDVNVNGSLALLSLAQKQGVKTGKSVKFIFPSTIATHGPADSSVDMSICAEGENLFPITMYGVNKLYVESLGWYFSRCFGMLNPETANQVRVDFRSVRFPGLISAETVPTGGTSDYGAEMVHAAAKGVGYKCFVKPESTLPFMIMSDAIRALVELSNAAKEKLTQNVYSVGAFSCSAEQIRQAVLKAFPEAQIGYEINEARLRIVESWPRNVDDSAAQKDWAWQAKYNFDQAFQDYLIPQIKERYDVNEILNNAQAAYV